MEQIIAVNNRGAKDLYMQDKILMCVIGAQGSIGTTLAAGICNLEENPSSVESYLITCQKHSNLKKHYKKIEFCGWDVKGNTFSGSFHKNKPFKEETFNKVKEKLDEKIVLPAPDSSSSIFDQVEQIRKDIKKFRESFPNYKLVAVNVLPASDIDYSAVAKLQLEEIYQLKGKTYSDLAYLLGCLHENIPFINFTPNPIELPSLVKLAKEKRTVMCGRDGKTGQTYWKIVLASGFAQRSLKVNGWYSTNILGNDDGLNLNNPGNANNKIKQKAFVLDKSLGYPVKDHLVRIDYYAPRKDNKESFDVIDFTGFLDEEMSMRVNLQCKDSILAAPIIIDVAKISAFLQYHKNRSGIIPELALFFKYPLGGENLNTFQEQIAALESVLAPTVNPELELITA